MRAEDPSIQRPSRRYPPRLSGLEELALNLRWTWDSRAYKVFQHLDPEMLEKCGGNPVLLLRRISRERLEHAAGDSAFLTHLDEALDDLRRYMARAGLVPAAPSGPVATCASPTSAWSTA